MARLRGGSVLSTRSGTSDRVIEPLHVRGGFMHDQSLPSADR